MTESFPPVRRSPRSRGPSGVLPVLLLVCLVLHAAALYTPGSPDVSSPFPFDKAAHLALFGVPAAVAVMAAGPWRRWVPSLLVAHAAVSEFVQGALIPNRAGDAWDALADVIGVLVGCGVGAVLAARARGRPGRCAAVGRRG